MNERTKSIKSITEGGIFTAAYALLAIISRYLLTGTDSLIYYFTPLLMAIYYIRNKISYSVAVLFASIALSFLFATPLIALMVITPNIIIGFTLGCLEKNCKIKLINYISIFSLCFMTSIVGIKAFELINGVDYFEDVVSIINNFIKYFPALNNETISSIVKVLSFVVILLDSIIKTVLLYLVISIIVIRLNLINNYSVKIKLPLRFSFITSIIYICLFAVFAILLNVYLINSTFLTEMFVAITLSALFLFSMYLTYQTIIFIRFKFKNIKNIYIILITIACVFLMPISTIFGLVLNFINYNILVDLI